MNGPDSCVSIQRFHTSIAHLICVHKLANGSPLQALPCALSRLPPTANDVVPKNPPPLPPPLVRASRFSPGISGTGPAISSIELSTPMSRICALRRSQHCCSHSRWIHCREVCFCSKMTVFSVPVPSGKNCHTCRFRARSDVHDDRQEPWSPFAHTLAWPR